MLTMSTQKVINLHSSILCVTYHAAFSDNVQNCRDGSTCRNERSLKIHVRTISQAIVENHKAS